MYLNSVQISMKLEKVIKKQKKRKGVVRAGLETINLLYFFVLKLNISQF